MAHAVSDPDPSPRPQGGRGTPPPSRDGLLSCALRCGLLAVYVGTVYVIVVAVGGGSRGRPTPPWWLTVSALLIIAATCLPVHTWLRVRLDRLIHDWHANPYAVLSWSCLTYTDTR